MNKIFIFIVFVVIAIIAFQILNAGMNRGERAECMQWADDAQRISDYWLTQWQADQCAFHGIKVEAPIKTWRK